mmetsp:Transcript_11694/g.10164  ORF Transcript_11694/g.10164 Transcript_11694/m.10164 type:complete len:87 (-) Transcript_11694:342-602(-)
MHGKGIAHLDVKLSNMLLGENFDLKIADFDSAYTRGDIVVLGKGSKNYRPPELKETISKDPWAVDIYSAGIVVFNLLTGSLPFTED